MTLIFNAFRWIFKSIWKLKASTRKIKLNNLVKRNFFFHLTNKNAQFSKVKTCGEFFIEQKFIFSPWNANEWKSFHTKIALSNSCSNIHLKWAFPLSIIVEEKNEIIFHQIYHNSYFSVHTFSFLFCHLYCSHSISLHSTQWTFSIIVIAVIFIVFVFNNIVKLLKYEFMRVERLEDDGGGKKSENLQFYSSSRSSNFTDLFYYNFYTLNKFY